MNDVISNLLVELDIHPVLIDVGASGTTPEIWDSIAKHSIYVGFDPDLRDIQELSDEQFHKAVIVNEAIVSQQESKEVLFYLTKSPYCSSVLKPDSKSLADFIFSDYFVVERETTVRATTLNSVIARLSLKGVDWLKIFRLLCRRKRNDSSRNYFKFGYSSSFIERSGLAED